MLRLISEGTADEFAVIAIAKTELHSSIRRRQRSGDIGKGITDRILELADGHFDARYIVQPVSAAIVDDACVFVDRYNLKTIDAVHLSAFRTFWNGRGNRRVALVSADQQLLRAAEKERMLVIDASF